MHLIVGLGNPGATYQGTRHNIGFQLLDYLADTLHVSFSDSKWNARVVKTSLSGNGVILVKPETFMNESGRAVGAIATYYRIRPENIIVVHDDLDLALGRIKVVVGRGAGGHNGILSLVSHLQSNDFVRIRLGIGRPDPMIPVKNFVLTRFSSEERASIDGEMTIICQTIQLILEKGPLFAMSMVNSRKV
ncbi:MAG: aminoacyl-tRNA hydrolase [Proteobacteria bacterium]|nr:aminoacyl-tRNA hydrolase [Pseudomonadota bacterium]